MFGLLHGAERFSRVAGRLGGRRGADLGAGDDVAVAVHHASVVVHDGLLPPHAGVPFDGNSARAG